MGWYEKMKKGNVWKYATVGILMASICLSIYYYYSVLLEGSTRQISRGSMKVATSFAVNLGRATFFLNVQRPEMVDAYIQAYVYCAQGALENIGALRELNPQHKNMLRPIEDVVRVLAIAMGPPTVPQVLYRVSCNDSLAMLAMAELKQAAGQTISEMGHEVSEAFTSAGVDTSRLNNAINLANKLQDILNQWIKKYSQA